MSWSTGGVPHPGSPGFLLLGLPLPPAVLSAVWEPSVVPCVEKLLAKVLLSCLELGTSVPMETAPVWGIWRICQRLSNMSLW